MASNNHPLNSGHLFVITMIMLCLTVDARKLTFNKLECLDHNNDVCGDLACSINGKKAKSFSLGCTMKQPTSEMKWHAKAIYQNPKMKTPYEMESRGDYCDIVNGRIDSAAIKMGMPLVRTFLPQLAKPCPYSGRLEVADFDPNEIMSMFPPFAPTGDYTMEFEVINDKNEVIIRPKLAITIKN